MKLLSPLFAGLIFGLGLCLSGMTDPQKVLGVLDLAGDWDPSLALVMGGAVVIAFIAFRAAGAREKTFGGGPLHLPTTTTIDARLLGGSALFGAGWGLVGLCPGPAIVDLGWLDPRAAMFVVAMAGGVVLADAIAPRAATGADLEALKPH
jgi:hypothetical protein